MSKTYELWDTATRNLIGAYNSEAEALGFVRRYVSQHARDHADVWVLLWDDDAADDGAEIAAGAALVALAEVDPPENRSQSTRPAKPLAG